MKILVIGDCTHPWVTYQSNLEGADVIVELEETVEEALSLLRHYHYDVACVASDATQLTAERTIRAVRREEKTIPLMAICSSGDPTLGIRSLANGADDFVDASVSAEELEARLRSLVRRSNGVRSSVVTIGNLEIDTEAKAVRVRGRAVPMSKREYQIVEILALRRGKPVTVENFLDRMYGGLDEPNPHVISVFICKIRRRLSEHAIQSYIKCIRGVGYSICEAE